MPLCCSSTGKGTKVVKGKSRTNITEESYTEADKMVLSMAIGSLGISCMVLLITLVVLSDLPSFVSDLQMCCGTKKQIHKWRRVQRKKEGKKKGKSAKQHKRKGTDSVSNNVVVEDIATVV